MSDNRPFLDSLNSNQKEYAILKEMAEKNGILIVMGMIIIPRNEDRILVLCKRHAHAQVDLLQAQERISGDEARILRLQIDESAMEGDLKQTILQAMEQAITEDKKQKTEQLIKSALTPN